MPLTPRQKRFVDAYEGNAAAAARAAGYGSPETCGPRLLRNVQVAKAIAARETMRATATIATREDRQKFWTATMNDVAEDANARLKASELLGKSEADFTDKHEHSTRDGVPLVVFLPEKKSA